MRATELANRGDHLKPWLLASLSGRPVRTASTYAGSWTLVIDAHASSSSKGTLRRSIRSSACAALTTASCFSVELVAAAGQQYRGLNTVGTCWLLVVCHLLHPYDRPPL
jgi:hypothetical protein